jgi:hypothetical protein
MAGVRIYWEAPIDPDVTRFQVFAGVNASSLVFQTEIDAVKPGPNWMEARQRFFYDDPTGTTDSYYQVLSLTGAGIQVQDTGIFQPSSRVGADLSTRVSINHNYGGQDALRFVTESGVGIPDATIRIFREADYAANQTTTPIVVARTLGDGRWDRPVYLEPGFNYVLTFEKPSAFTASPVTITV